MLSVQELKRARRWICERRICLHFTFYTAH